MTSEWEVPDALIRRAFGPAAISVSRGAALRHAGLQRLALTELRRVVRRDPSDGAGWAALLEYFLAEQLWISALALVRAIDQRGFSACVSTAVREQLARFSAVPPIALYVPCFNAAATVGAVIESVRAQSIRPAQIIVVDDCSTDGTAEVVTRFPEVELIRHDLNRGVGAARNSALAAVLHPLVASLDSDVVAGEFWLERLLVAMIESPAAGAFGALVERHAVRLPDRWRARVMPLLYPGEGDIDDAVLYGSNTLFATTALRAVGGYNPRYTRAFDDTDLGNKLRAAGLHIRYVHRAVCEHTRCDTLQAVLRSCYAYRRERALKDRLFDRLETLEARWNTLIRDGITEIEELQRTGSGSVLYPSLLNIFWTIARDLSEFLGGGDEASRRTYVAAVAAALDRAIGEIPALSDSVGVALRRALEPVTAELTRGEFPTPSAAEIDPIYERCFAKVAIVLHFSPAIRAALERGARESLDVEGRDLDRVKRLAVVTCGYLLGDGAADGATQSLEPGILPRARAAGVDVVAFDRSMPLSDLRQRAAALSGYRPMEVMLVASGERTERIASAILRLFDWCGTDLHLTVVGTAIGFEELLGVEFSPEDAAPVLERLVLSR